MLWSKLVPPFRLSFNDSKRSYSKSIGQQIDWTSRVFQDGESAHRLAGFLNALAISGAGRPVLRFRPAELAGVDESFFTSIRPVRGPFCSGSCFWRPGLVFSCSRPALVRLGCWSLRIARVPMISWLRQCQSAACHRFQCQISHPRSSRARSLPVAPPRDCSKLSAETAWLINSVWSTAGHPSRRLLQNLSTWEFRLGDRGGSANGRKLEKTLCRSLFALTPSFFQKAARQIALPRPQRGTGYLGSGFGLMELAFNKPQVKAS